MEVWVHTDRATPRSFPRTTYTRKRGAHQAAWHASVTVTHGIQAEVLSEGRFEILLLDIAQHLGNDRRRVGPYIPGGTALTPPRHILRECIALDQATDLAACGALL